MIQVNMFLMESPKICNTSEPHILFVDTATKGKICIVGEWNMCVIGKGTSHMTFVRLHINVLSVGGQVPFCMGENVHRKEFDGGIVRTYQALPHAYKRLGFGSTNKRTRSVFSDVIAALASPLNKKKKHFSYFPWEPPPTAISIFDQIHGILKLWRKSLFTCDDRVAVGKIKIKAFIMLIF